MRDRLFAALLALALAAGCSQQGPQIFIHVDADEAVRRDIRELRVRIWGRDAAGQFDDLAPSSERDYPRGQLEWPWVLSIIPNGNDHRRVWRVEAAAVDASDRSAFARAASGFLPGEAQHVYLFLDNQCFGVEMCTLDQTCRFGECVDLTDPMTFNPEAGLPDAGAPPDAGIDPMDGGRECAAEECNGRDDDCDTRVDEDIAPGGACDGDDADLCLEGSLICSGGARVCSDESDDNAELCNREDDDCDNTIDEGFDLMADVANCGSCGLDCRGPSDNGVARCDSGSCAWECAAGFYDCDGAVPGCETPVGPDDCGGCDSRCQEPNPICDVGSASCTNSCSSPRRICSNSCVDVQSDDQHCGECDNACARPGTAASCSGGSCDWTCQSGFLNCDNNFELNGCEVTEGAEVPHCLGCNMPCPPAPTNASFAVPGCVGGACAYVCDAGFADCDGDLHDDGSNGCEVRVGKDADHCVACNMACVPPTNAVRAAPGCVGGACRFECAAGFGDCDTDLHAGPGSNGCETTLGSHTQCTTCTDDCTASPPQCQAGICTAGGCTNVPQSGTCNPPGPCDMGMCNSGACEPRCDGGGVVTMDAGGFFDASTDGGSDAGADDAGSSCSVPCADPDYCCAGNECCLDTPGSVCFGSCMPDPTCGSGPGSDCAPDATCCGGVCCESPGDCEDAGGGDWSCLNPDDPCEFDPCGATQVCCPNLDSTYICCASGTTCAGGGVCMPLPPG